MPLPKLDAEIMKSLPTTAPAWWQASQLAQAKQNRIEFKRIVKKQIAKKDERTNARIYVLDKVAVGMCRFVRRVCRWVTGLLCGWIA